MELALVLVSAGLVTDRRVSFISGIFLFGSGVLQWIHLKEIVFFVGNVIGSLLVWTDLLKLAKGTVTLRLLRFTIERTKVHINY